MKINDEQILITDEDGKEFVFKILFSYENKQRGNNYVFFYDEKDEDNVLFARYYEDGHLEYIEDEEELAEIEEVFATFVDENFDQEEAED